MDRQTDRWTELQWLRHATLGAAVARKNYGWVLAIALLTCDELVDGSTLQSRSGG